MKTKLKLLLALLSLCAYHSALTTAIAQGTAFTYQGQLRSNGVPLNGLYDFVFTLSNAPSGGSQVGSPVTDLAVGVTNGLFTTILDFGAVFTGNDTWLAISVRSNNVGSYTPLTPLQELTPTPYAIYTPNAGNAATATSATSAATAATANNVANGIDITNAVITNSVFSGNGGGLTNLNSSQLASDANSNLFVGPSGNSTTTGSFNTAVGISALQSNTTGYENAAVGVSALQDNTNGSRNTAYGNYALQDNTTGNDNTAVGIFALEYITTGNDNTAVGEFALGGNPGNTTGSENTATGWEALTYNMTGNDNTGIGFNALALLGYINSAGGTNNIALGYLAGHAFTGNESSNIDIGNGGVLGDQNIIRIGSNQTTAYIAGVITGNGGGLTSLTAANIASGGTLPAISGANLTSLTAANLTGTGTLPVAVLPFSVALLNGNQTFTNVDTFSNGLNVATSAGTLALVNDGGAVPGITATGGLVSGHMRLRNGVEVWPDNAQANGGYLDVRDTNTTATITLTGSSGAIVCSNITGNGANLTSLNAAQLTSGSIQTSVLPGFQSSSNYSAIGGGQNNTVSGSTYSVIGGGTNNVLTNVDGSAIVGGLDNTNNGNQSTIGGGAGNVIQVGAYYALLGSGGGNVIQTNADATVLGGGYHNLIASNAAGSFLGGGQYNAISNNATFSVLGGGYGNTNSGNYATVTGGYLNLANNSYATVTGYENQATGISAVVAGGSNNIAGGGNCNVSGGANNQVTQLGGAIGGGYFNTNTATYATIPGGYKNLAGGSYAFAAGENAQANNNNSFVWSDGSATTTSSANSQFLVRASGGVTFFTSSGNTDGAALAANGSSWGSPSDRNVKKNFQPVDTKAVLAKLAAIPIQQWNYKWEKDGDVPNIGPMAQDFKGAFYPGRDDKSITTLEFDGVELAAIQGLNQKLNEKDAEIKKLKEKADKVDSLEKQLNELAATVKLLAERK